MSPDVTPSAADVPTSTRDRIYWSAHRQFVERSFHGATMSDIAAGAGVHTGNVYYYFTSKEELFVEIVSDRIERMTTAIDAIASLDAPIEQRLRLSIAELVRGAIESPAPAMLGAIEEILRVVDAQSALRIVEARGHYESIFRGLVREGVTAGVVHVDDVSVASFAAMGMATSCSRWFRSGRRLDLDTVADMHAVYALRLLGINNAA